MSDDGWILTGDLGRFRDDGNLVLCGRITEMYIRGGYNVYPLEVENVLAEHPGVERVAVLGVPAPVIGEIGVAFVVRLGVTRRPDGARSCRRGAVNGSPTTRRPTASRSSTSCRSPPCSRSTRAPFAPPSEPSNDELASKWRDYPPTLTPVR